MAKPRSRAPACTLFICITFGGLKQIRIPRHCWRDIKVEHGLLPPVVAIHARTWLLRPNRIIIVLSKARRLSQLLQLHCPLDAALRTKRYPTPIADLYMQARTAGCGAARKGAHRMVLVALELRVEG